MRVFMIMEQELLLEGIAILYDLLLHSGPKGGASIRAPVYILLNIMSDNDRYNRGKELLDSLKGELTGTVLEEIGEFLPEFAKITVEFPFGDIYSRTQLDLRSREIATIAALTALGHALPELRDHIHLGLNAGLSKDEVIEILMQMAVYAGFPAAINALRVAKEVFLERGIIN